MSSFRFSNFIRLVFVVVLIFLPVTNGLAQSAVDLVVHFVDGKALQDGSSYDVRVYLSVVDGKGNSAGDLSVDAFTLMEDNQKMDVLGFDMAGNAPMNIVLVMDTSGSMSGAGINNAKAAASAFVAGLNPEGQVAVLTFDNNVKTQVELTADRPAVLNRIEMIDAVRDAGSCLYDAAYQAVQMASASSGNRAVILLTDSKDELNKSGAICSVHNIDDVVKIASEGGTRTPIYILGMGPKIEPLVLKRITGLTGGLYLYAQGSSQLTNTFQKLSDQLRSQYVLTYKSFAGPGPHTLIVSVNQFGSPDIDTRNFLLPALPAKITFLMPQEGETVGDVLKVAVALTSPGETVERVTVGVNGLEIGVDDTSPYEFELDLKPYPDGILPISAIAYGANNAVLTTSSVNVAHVASAATNVPAVIPTGVAPVSSPTPVPQKIKPAVLLGIGIGGLGIFTIVLLLFITTQQQRKARLLEEEENSMLPPPPVGSVFREVYRDRPVDTEVPVTDALGALVVEVSDDETMIGHRFELTSGKTTLGRSADNDINFPKDTPVSRKHAEIIEFEGRLHLKQIESIDSSGNAILPKYGTALNDIPIDAEPVPLANGDVILLGRRVRLKFELYERTGEGEELTRDEMDSAFDPDKTQDQ